jgi:hypothetical protein
LHFVAFGGYVIYSIKESSGNQHLTTLHAQLGAVALLGYTGLGFAGFFGLHPDFGFAKGSKELRLAHKWGGRAMTLLSWVAALLHIIPKTTGNVLVQAAIIIPLFIFGYYALV